MNEFKKEFEILSTIRSPYTVRFYGAALEPQVKKNEKNMNLTFLILNFLFFVSCVLLWSIVRKDLCFTL